MESVSKMYVCICNALNEDTVRKACIESGARSVREVYLAHGCQAQCGKCSADMRQLITDTHDSLTDLELSNVEMNNLEINNIEAA